jgi:hypothetical protein
MSVTPPSGALAPSPAKPVTIAPFDALAGEDVTKICAAALEPPAFATRTSPALAQEPLVSVKLNENVSDECVNPSKLVKVRLKFPNVLTLPEPVLTGVHAEKPVPPLEQLTNAELKVAALTFTAAELPSPRR